MRRLEVVDDDSWLALAPVQEAAQLGDERGFVGRPRVQFAHVALDVLVEVLVGVELWAVGGQEEQLDPVAPLSDPGRDGLGVVGGVVVADSSHGANIRAVCTGSEQTQGDRRSRPCPSLTAVVLGVTPAIVAARVEPSKLISCAYIE